MDEFDTIAAIATPPGTGGIGVIRLSGSQAIAIAEQLTDSKLKPRQASLRKFYAADHSVLDYGIALVFIGPHSFTGEDVVEIQGHGGQILQEMLLARVCELGARLAHPGEYSERAFHNDKIDLAQAEAIADLIESGSQAAAKAAMRSLQGEFSDKVHELVAQIIDLRAYVEAALDFAEEEIDFLQDSMIQQRFTQLIEQTETTLQQAENGCLLNEGMSMAIAGLPNAGKSSLLNYLTGYDAAIVTDIEGTTRDVIKEHIALKGIPVRIIDTAGLRESDDPVEREGIRRAWREIEQADIVLQLVDAVAGFSEQDQMIKQRLQNHQCQVRRIYTKADKLPGDKPSEFDSFLISTKTGQGIDQLIDALTEQYHQFDAQQSTFIARQRHVELVKQALESIQQANQVFEQTLSGELMAEDLRQAQKFLNEVTGEFTTEDLLGKIFSSFCIGK